MNLKPSTTNLQLNYFVSYLLTSIYSKTATNYVSAKIYDKFLLQFQLTFVQKEPHKDKIAGPQTMERLSDLMAKSNATAVFLSVNMLNANQLTLLQKQWKLPVYDR